MHAQRRGLVVCDEMTRTVCVVCSQHQHAHVTASIEVVQPGPWGIPPGDRCVSMVAAEHDNDGPRLFFSLISTPFLTHLPS